MENSTVTFLTKASVLYRESCPELSRFLLKGPQEDPSTEAHRLYRETSICQHCYQWLRPGNHHVRIRPKRRPAARVQSVLLREARGKRLSLVQRALLRRFRGAPSARMATCNSCNQTSRLNGANRDFMSGFSKSHSTPGKRHTPQSANRAHTTAPKSASKDKTPWSTPRSSTPSTPSSGSSSSKSPSQAKAWVVQRLSKLLKRDDKQSSKKGTLKDFLSSL